MKLYDTAVLDELLAKAGFRAWPVHCRRCGKVTGNAATRNLDIICGDCLTPEEREWREMIDISMFSMENALLRPPPKPAKMRGLVDYIGEAEE